MELLDESWGRPYYYHTGTFVTQWERPEGFEGVSGSGQLEVGLMRLRFVWGGGEPYYQGVSGQVEVAVRRLRLVLGGVG